MSAESFFETAKGLFEQDKYAEAKTLLETAKLDPSAGPIMADIDMWLRKCYTHLGGAPPIVTKPAPAPVAAAPTAAPSVSSPPAAASSSSTAASKPETIPVKVKGPAGQPKVEFSQTASDVTISIFIPDRSASDVSVDLDKRSLTINIKTGSGKEFQHVVESLFGAVKGAAVINPRPSRVEVTLKKAAPFQWDALETPRVPSAPKPGVIPPEAIAAASTAPAPAAPAPAPVPAAAPVTTAAAGPAKPRFEWFQSAAEVTLTYFVKERKPEDVAVSVSDRTVSVSIVLPSGGDPYVHNLNLFADVVQTAPPKISVRSMKIEVIFTKTQGYQWAALEATSSSASDVVVNTSGQNATATTTDAPATQKDLKYPNSKGKDWNKVQFNPEDEYKAEGGDAALNALFKQIYSNGSDDQRMAMMKSFQESGGTVLSTNWADVGSKTVKPEAPRGMEEKKYGD